MKPVDEQKILKLSAELHQKYEDDVVQFNYPGIIFYISPSWYWLTEQSKKYFGCTMPFLLFFVKDGACNFESEPALGPGEVIMKQLEKEGLAWVKKSEKRLVKAEQHLYKWLSTNRVESGRNLSQYLKLLHEINGVYLADHIHFQISIHMDKYLHAKLLKVFREVKSALSDKEIFYLCISDKKSDVIVHDEEIAKLRAWCEKKKIILSPENYEKNVQNLELRKRLQACYDIGYFLRSGYGGVTLWTLKDEYKTVAEAKTITPIHKTTPKLTFEQKKWVKISKHFSTMRDRRKTLQQKVYYYEALLLEEIAKIIKIPRLELEHLRMEQFTQEFITSTSLKNVIADQKSAYLIFWEKTIGFKIWTSNDAIKAYAKTTSSQQQGIKELKGNVGSQGKAQGRVKIIFNPRLHGANFKEGDVLVTGMTSPDFVPLMKKAAAIITELGGITCHAAIISRELGKPCIIGTKIATKVLKDGDLVEVDANTGIVRKLKR